jgi:hypothetical protein
MVTKKKKTPWSESASELYRPSDRRTMVTVINKFMFVLKRMYSHQTLRPLLNPVKIVSFIVCFLNGYRKDAKYEDKNKKNAFYRKVQV